MQIDKLKPVLASVAELDANPASVAALVGDAIDALETQNYVGQRPTFHRGTQASFQQGRFKLNSHRRRVQTVDRYAFVPYSLEADDVGAAPAEVPPSTLCVLDVDFFYVVSWEGAEYRFATGTMYECKALGGHGLATGFCDGSLGRRVVLPSLLSTTSTPVKYPYAVWFKDVRCSCLSARSTSGGDRNLLLTPVVKSTFRG